jgi:outer membrane cobalamin receptor
MLGRVRFSLSTLVQIVLTIVLTVSLGFAQVSGIHGTVLNSAGAPLEGATVRLIENGIERARTTSDDHGRFTIATACSSCVVEVIGDGFWPLTFPASTSRELNVTMGVRTTVKESVVVTATGRETMESRVGASVTVLDREEIQQRHALSTIDLLRTVPGVVAVRTGGVGNLTSLFVRGGESTYNKVLLDGMPLNEPGGFFNFASLSPENIERIEVLRGAHSALFGSDAMASVIQIFTTRPDSTRPQVHFTADAGTYNTGHVAAGVGATSGPLEYSVFGSRLQTDNREPNNTNRTATVSGLLTRRLQSGAAARVIGRGDFGRSGVPGATAFGRADMDAFFRHRDGNLLTGWTQPLGSRVVHQASYSYGASNQRSTNLQADPPYTARFGDLTGAFPLSDFLYDSETDLRRHHVEYRADAIVAPNQTLTGAFAYDGERGVLTNHRSTATPQRPERNNFGTTVQYEAVTDAVSVTAGVRFENNGSFGFYVAPRLAASWQMHQGNAALGPTRIRGTIGRGIKEPTFLQSYSPSISFFGNPDLKPERSRGFDVAVQQRFARDRVGLEATYFANHFDELISLGPSDPVTFASQYTNIGETRASGLELAGNAVMHGSLQLRGSYTLLDSKVIRSTSSSRIFEPGKPLYRRPRHTGAVQALFTRGRVGAALGGVFVGSRVDTDFNFPTISSNAGYATWNASGEVKLARRTGVFITLDNLADRQYMDPLGYPALRRTIRVGVRTRF